MDGKLFRKVFLFGGFTGVVVTNLVQHFLG